MDRKNVGALGIGIGVGLSLALIPLAIQTTQAHKREMILYEDYLAQKALYEEALANWRNSENVHFYYQQMVNAVTNQLQQHITALENKPPVIEYVEVKVPVNIPYYPKLTYFDSLEELTEWVTNWQPENWTEENETHVYHIGAWDCDDYSVALVRDAALAGKIIGFVLDPVWGHMLNGAIIGNDYYFVEPKTKVIADTLNGVHWIVD
jgi:hypothetical protein